MPGPMVLNDRSRSFCFWYPGDVSVCPSLLLGNPLMKTGPSSVSGNWGPCQSGTCFKFVTDTMRSNDSLNAQQPNMQNCSLRKTSRTSYAKSIREIKLAAPAISIHVSRFYLSLLRQQHNMSGVDWLCPTWWVGQGSPAPDVGSIWWWRGELVSVAIRKRGKQDPNLWTMRRKCYLKCFLGYLQDDTEEQVRINWEEVECTSLDHE